MKLLLSILFIILVPGGCIFFLGYLAGKIVYTSYCNRAKKDLDKTKRDLANESTSKETQ